MVHSSPLTVGAVCIRRLQMLLVCLDAGVIVPMHGARDVVSLVTETGMPFRAAVPGAGGEAGEGEAAPGRASGGGARGMPPFLTHSSSHVHGSSYVEGAYIGALQLELATAHYRKVTSERAASGGMVSFLKHSITASRRAAASSKLGQRLGAAARDALGAGSGSSEGAGDRLAREIKDVYARERSA